MSATECNEIWTQELKFMSKYSEVQLSEPLNKVIEWHSSAT